MRFWDRLKWCVIGGAGYALGRYLFMAKNNIRSVRFSDEMIEIINQQVGENFTQKFERMVYNCYMLLPEKERQAERLDMLISDKQKALSKLQDRYYAATQFISSLEARLRDLNRLFDMQS